MENKTNKQNELSGCCEALILDADKNGHGRCADCKENCTTLRELELEYEQYMYDRVNGGR